MNFTRPLPDNLAMFWRQIVLVHHRKMYMKETEIWDGCDSVSFAVTIFENHTFNMMKLKQKHLKNTHTLKKLPAGIHTNGFQVLKTP